MLVVDLSVDQRSLHSCRAHVSWRCKGRDDLCGNTRTGKAYFLNRLFASDFDCWVLVPDGFVGVFSALLSHLSVVRLLVVRLFLF